MVSPYIIILSTDSILASRAVWFLTTGINFFNCSVEEFPLCWQEMIEPNLILGTVGGPSSCFLMTKSYLGCLLLICIHQSSAGPCHTICILYKAATSVWIISRINIAPRSTQPTTHFHMALSTTIKTSNTLIFLDTFRNQCSYPNIRVWSPISPYLRSILQWVLFWPLNSE